MRSEVAKKILSETPQEVKDEVRSYGNEVITRRQAEIEAFQLTPEQEKYYLSIGKNIEWHKALNEDPSFRAKN